MKKFLLLICATLMGVICAGAKDVKISVTPSDAKIYIDGNYVGDGVTTASLKQIREMLYRTLFVEMHSMMSLSHPDW